MPDSKRKRLPAADMLARVTEMAANLFDPEQDKEEMESYINQHMEKGGYKQTITWGDPDDDHGSGRGGRNGGGWFGQ